MGGSKDNEAEEVAEPSKVPSSEELVLTICSLKGPRLFFHCWEADQDTEFKIQWL